MNHKDLEYIVEVARSGSIIKAAENLFITPSALSQYVRNVEKKLGAELFDRSGKQFRLTNIGEKYNNWSKKIINMENQMEKEIMEMPFSNSGKLRVGFPPSFLEFLTSYIMPLFRQKYPKVELCLKENRTFISEKMFNDNELDVVLTNVDVIPPYQDYILLNKAEIVLIVPSNHFLLEKAIRKPGFLYPWIDLSLCRDENFIVLYPNQYLRQVTEKILHDFSINKPITITLNNINSIIKFVKSGIGISLLCSEPHVLFFEESVKCLSFGMQPQNRNIIVAYKKEHDNKNISDYFISLISEQYKMLSHYPD